LGGATEIVFAVVPAEMAPHIQYISWLTATSMEPAKPTPTWKPEAVISFVLFFAGNVGLNFFNSWALKKSPDDVPGLGKGGFTFPYFYTMWHMLATSCAALLLQMTCQKPKDGSLPSFGQLWEYKWQLVPIAILTYFNAGFNNASLGSIALFVNQVIKACAPAPVSFFEWLITGKLYNSTAHAVPALSPPHPCTLLTVCTVCAAQVQLQDLFARCAAHRWLRAVKREQLRRGKHRDRRRDPVPDLAGCCCAAPRPAGAAHGRRWGRSEAMRRRLLVPRH
jgi:hypothetical protein